ncbi:MAG: hypothetical protein AAFV80_20285, partial [Bacteroidota bacterium]
ILSAIGIVFLFKLLLFVAALLFFLLSRLKILIQIKIGGILAAMAGGLFTFLAGPIGIFVWIFIVLLALASIQEAFLAIYQWFFDKLSEALLRIRSFYDTIRSNSDKVFHPIAMIGEAITVCSFAAFGLWSILDIVDGKDPTTVNQIIGRVLVSIPYVLLLYRNYLKVTSDPNSGGDGIDTPMIVDFVDVMDDIF